MKEGIGYWLVWNKKKLNQEEMLIYENTISEEYGKAKARKVL